MARRRYYRNTLGERTKEVKTDGLTSRGTDYKYVNKLETGRNPLYVSREYDDDGNVDFRKGTVRKGKTTEQVRAQLARIDENAAYLRERDRFRIVGGPGLRESEEREKEINGRTARAKDAARAFENYLALGAAKGASVG